MSKEIDKKKFKQIFGHALIKLVDKLINTTEKEEHDTLGLGDPTKLLKY